jgi:hypothetical protein
MIKSRSFGLLILLACLGGCTDANNTFSFDAAADAAGPARSDATEAGTKPETGLADQAVTADLAVDGLMPIDLPFDVGAVALDLGPARSDAADTGLTADTSLADRPLETGLPDLAVDRAGDVPLDIAIDTVTNAADATVD